MFDTIGGIPLHPLIVHAVVVLVPLAALLVLLAALSPRIRAWAGILTPITATIALIMVPFATQSGEALEKRVAESAAVEEHAELGDSLVFFVLFLALAAWALWFVDRRSRATAPDGASGGGAAGGRAWIYGVSCARSSSGSETRRRRSTNESSGPPSSFASASGSRPNEAPPSSEATC